MGDRVGWGMDEVGYSPASEAEQLSGITESIGVVGVGVVLDVNHMELYCLRVSVYSMRCIVWCWVFGCLTIVHDRDGVLSTGTERRMWVTKVSIVI